MFNELMQKCELLHTFKRIGGNFTDMFISLIVFPSSRGDLEEYTLRAILEKGAPGPSPGWAGLRCGVLGRLVFLLHLDLDHAEQPGQEITKCGSHVCRAERHFETGFVGCRRRAGSSCLTQCIAAAPCFSRA